MHYCLMFLSKDFPTDDVINAALKPFSDDVVYKDADEDGTNIVYPAFTWDWWQVGGRYNGKLKLKYDLNDDTSEYRWMFTAREPRIKRLFRSYLLEAFMETKKSPFFFEDDYLSSMGARDGYLYVDGGKIVDMLNFKEECTKCFCYLDTDGNAYARRTWSNHEWVEDAAFEDKVKAACENRTDGYVTIIDLHD